VHEIRHFFSESELAKFDTPEGFLNPLDDEDMDSDDDPDSDEEFNEDLWKDDDGDDEDYVD
jgi:hypothetical protein